MTEKNLSEIGRRILLQQMAKENNEGSTTVSAKPAQDRSYKEAVDVVEREPETIQEILAAASSATATIGTNLLQSYSQLSAVSPDMTTSAWSYLTEGGKREATRDYRQGLANEARSEAIERYTEATSTLQEKLAAREKYVKSELFGSNQNAEVLARFAFASDAEIKRASELANLTGNAELRSAVLAAAASRDLGEILSETLTEQERDFLNELAALPGDEVRNGGTGDLTRVLPIADERYILPPAKGSS
jgi:hypothetical protein